MYGFRSEEYDMLPKSLDIITQSDIDALIQDQVREERTIEYKAVLPGSRDEDKREFSKDVSSFANAAGGDLIYGIKAEGGIPKEATGLKGDLDSGILKLEGIIRTGVEPRIPGIRFRPIAGFSDGPVLIVHIPKSWSAPHMVKINDTYRCYTRNSAGNYLMDVAEIRSAFLLSEALPEKIKRFRDERLARIIVGETPVPIPTGGKLVLHMLPISSFTTDFKIDMGTFRGNTGGLPLMDSSALNYRYNLDGFLTYNLFSKENRSRSYCQLFRDGKIESVCTDFINEHEGRRYIASVSYEKDIIEVIPQYILGLKKFGISSPILIIISLLGVSGTYLFVDTWSFHTKPAPIDRDTLLLPDILIEDYSAITDTQAVARELRPVFDTVWNACGFERSLNYDEEGKWRPMR
jgi:hypothetical protein